jgi:hypothetical protein
MRERGLGWVLLGAAALAVLSARPYAGGWNDGSRLATVESLVDRHTFRIDDSIYATAPLVPGAPHPYGRNRWLNPFGTLDKLYIDGAFYSDKSPVPAVLMAGLYQGWRWVGAPSAADRPDWFARVLTWAFAGLPYVLAVWCVSRITQHLAVPSPWDVVLVASFAFGSIALPYAQHVNNHILLLGVAAAVCDSMVRPAELTPRRAAWLGLLTGFGYTIDLGAGPLLALSVGGFVLWKSPRRVASVTAFALAALPFIGAHHAITYSIAGTLGPANANPEFFRWPGSQFDADTMTGGWQHASIPKAGLYALDLLFGRKGFILHWAPLGLVFVTLPWLLKRRGSERAAVVALAAWAVGTWLLYAAYSRNLSGPCLSVRWFVPLLAPGCVALAIILREAPTWRRDLALGAACGFVLSVEPVVRGPWHGRMPTIYWPLLALTGLVWLVIVVIRTRLYYAFTPASISRTFFRSVEGVKGFWRKCVSSARTPWRKTSSGV